MEMTPRHCVRVARLALDYRQVFNKDIVVDMLCYRQHGHNEGDEPTYTNPVLYQKIQKKRSPRKLYTESLLNRGAMKPDEAEKMLDDFRELLQDAFERTSDLKEKDPAAILEHFHNRSYESPLPADTRASEDQLENILHALLQIPEGFNAHPKLMRQFERRNEKLRKSGQIDWAFAEALAFGTLLQEGTTVRLSGQDSRRATFSQRHAVIYDQITNAEYIPLNHITEDQARLHIYDSLLSEYAVAAFEYGYSVQNQDALVIWEATIRGPSPMVHKSSLTNFYPPPKKNGARPVAWSRYFHMDTKDRAPSIHLRAWNASFSFVLKEIWSSAT